MFRQLRLSERLGHRYKIETLEYHAGSITARAFEMIKVAVCVFWLALLAAARQPSASSHGSESLLLALENAWNQAQLHHDSKALGELIADTFVSTDSDGVFQTKAEFLADNKDPAYAPTVMTNSDVRVFLYENSAVVTGIYHAKGAYRGRPFDHYGRFTDAWAFLGGKWLCVATHTSPLKKH
jgi:hypothetical protein